MDDDAPSTFGSTTTLLWFAGIVAFLFILGLVVDSFLRWRRRRRKGRAVSDRQADVNFITRWFRRVRHNLRSLRHSYERDQRAKAARARARE